MCLAGLLSSSQFAGSSAGSWRFFFHNSLMPRHRSWRRRSESGGSCPIFNSKLRDFPNECKVLCHCMDEQFLTHLLKLSLKVFRFIRAAFQKSPSVAPYRPEENRRQFVTMQLVHGAGSPRISSVAFHTGSFTLNVTFIFVAQRIAGA